MNITLAYILIIYLIISNIFAIKRFSVLEDKYCKLDSLTAINNNVINKLQKRYDTLYFYKDSIYINIPKNINTINKSIKKLTQNDSLILESHMNLFKSVGYILIGAKVNNNLESYQ